MGIVTPLFLLYLDSASPAGWWPMWIIFVWPFAVVTWAMPGGSLDFEGHVIIAILVLLNGALYAFLAYTFYRLARKRGQKLAQ